MEEPKKFRFSINKNIVKFIMLFLGLLAVFYFLSIKFETSIPVFSMEHTARALNFFLKTVGINGEINGNQISFQKFSVIVVRQCTGIFEIIAIISCILAYPSSVKKKIIGISLAVPTIYIFNMIRLVVLTAVGVRYPKIFEIAHEYILQLTFVFLVIFFWIFWINRVVKNEKR